MKRTSGIALALVLAGFLTGVAVAPTEAATVASVAVSPDSAEAVIGDELEFEAAALDSSGGAVNVDIVWAVSDSLAARRNCAR